MTILFAVCAVIATIVMVLIGVVVFRMAKGLDRAEKEVIKSLEEFHVTIRSVNGVVQRSKALVESVEDSLEASASMVGDVTERFHQVTSAIMDEVERPVNNAVAVARGVRTGAYVFSELLMSRFGGHFDVNGERRRAETSSSHY